MLSIFSSFRSRGKKDDLKRKPLVVYFGESRATLHLGISDRTISVGQFLKRHSHGPDNRLCLYIEKKKVHCRVFVRLLSYQSLDSFDLSNSALVMDRAKRAKINEEAKERAQGARGMGTADRTGLLRIFSQENGVFQDCLFELFRDRIQYKKKASPQELRILYLQGVVVRVRSKAEHLFQIISRSKMVLFKCSTKLDMQSWHSAINQNIMHRFNSLLSEKIDDSLFQCHSSKFSCELQQNLSIAAPLKSLLKDHNKALSLDESDLEAVRQWAEQQADEAAMARVSRVVERQIQACEGIRDDGLLLRHVRQRGRIRIGGLFEQ